MPPSCCHALLWRHAGRLALLGCLSGGDRQARIVKRRTIVGDSRRITTDGRVSFEAFCVHPEQVAAAPREQHGRR
jgi:hypothetical protein